MKLLGILLNKTLEFSLAGANLSLAPAGNFGPFRLLFAPNKLGFKLLKTFFNVIFSDFFPYFLHIS